MTFSRVSESSIKNRLTAWVQRDRRFTKAIMWLIAVAIAVLCIYRSILVTPLPLNVQCSTAGSAFRAGYSQTIMMLIPPGMPPVMSCF